MSMAVISMWSLCMSRWESLDNPFMSESAYLHVDGCHLHVVTVNEPLGVLRQFMSESAYLHVDGCHLHVVTVYEPLGVLRQPVHVRLLQLLRDVTFVFLLCCCLLLRDFALQGREADLPLQGTNNTLFASTFCLTCRVNTFSFLMKG